MKQHLRMFGTLAWLAILLAPVALAQPKPLPFAFTGTLGGDQLPTPVETDGTGTVIAVLTGHELVVTGTYRDLSSPVNRGIAGGVNVRMALPGEDGRVVPLEAEQAALGIASSMTLKTSGGSSGIFSGVFTLTEEQIEALADGLLYVQIHTLRNVGGEVRGQIGPNDLYATYREYLTALEDPAVVHDATAADMVGIWRDTATGALWQDYEDGTWTGLDSLAEAGTLNSDWRWEFADDAFSVDWGSGSQIELSVFYEDGRRRYIVVEAQGRYTEPLGSWHEQVRIDEEGNRVNLRE